MNTIPPVWAVAVQDIPMLGFIPEWVRQLKEDESMVDCIHRNYGHGGGWQEFEGFTVDPTNGGMSYPGDPVQMPFAMCETDEEILWMYPGSWVTVMNKANQKARTARID